VNAVHLNIWLLIAGVALALICAGNRLPKKGGRTAYFEEHGNGPWSHCECVQPVRGEQAYFQPGLIVARRGCRVTTARRERGEANGQ